MNMVNNLAVVLDNILAVLSLILLLSSILVALGITGVILLVINTIRHWSD